ncbi:MAG: hypothetical protein IJO48_00085 [Clostridia bacterium]|nr:hypothetical protein [Clostridia bacterium]
MIRNNFSVAKRSILYVLITLLVIAVIILLAYGFMIWAMHTSNLYVLATEGMELRAGCIVTNGSVVELAEHFSQDFIDNDDALYDGKYKEFTVSAYDYRLTVESVSVMPWSNKASMKVVERMASMTGTANDESEENSARTALPPYVTARYKIEFKKTDGRWYISGLKLIEENPEQEQLPTPDMSLYKEPTPTPEMSAEAANG